jgi:hypothetical protein
VKLFKSAKPCSGLVCHVCCSKKPTLAAAF